MASLVKELDKVGAKNKDSISYVVYLSDKGDEAKTTLAAFAKTNKLTSVDMTLNKSGAKPPKGYKLNPEVTHTILMYSGNKVVQNFALDKIDAAATKKIVQAATKVFSSKPAKKGRKNKDKRRRKKKERKKKERGKDAV